MDVAEAIVLLLYALKGARQGSQLPDDLCQQNC